MSIAGALANQPAKQLHQKQNPIADRQPKVSKFFEIYFPVFRLLGRWSWIRPGPAGSGDRVGVGVPGGPPTRKRRHGHHLLARCERPPGLIAMKLGPLPVVRVIYGSSAANGRLLHR